MIYTLGPNGQLGLSLQKLGVAPIACDITDIDSLDRELKNISPGNFIVNSAAYTAVDKAEDDEKKAYLVNEVGVSNIAEVCNKYGLNLIHISTDYVFDGNTCEAYTERSVTNPIGVYGKSKLAGEVVLNTKFSDFIIIRTSWVYSEYRSNFLKTMLSLKDRETISVVYDQIGTPTYAADLASVIIKICDHFNEHKGQIYHYSNEGVCSWYDFAKEIFDQKQASVKVKAILSSDYPSKVTRPKVSLLSKEKIKKELNIEIPHWKESLKVCLKNLS